MKVFTVDAYDIVLSKLFSTREKDRDDLRDILPRLDASTLRSRLSANTKWLQAVPSARQAGEENWFILFGQPLSGVKVAY